MHRVARTLSLLFMMEKSTSITFNLGLVIYTSIKIIAVDILMNRNRPSTLELKATQKKIRENVQKYGNAFTYS